jgi:hypothetical protein
MTVKLTGSWIRRGARLVGLARLTVAVPLRAQGRLRAKRTKWEIQFQPGSPDQCDRPDPERGGDPSQRRRDHHLGLRIVGQHRSAGDDEVSSFPWPVVDQERDLFGLPLAPVLQRRGRVESLIDDVTAHPKAPSFVEIGLDPDRNINQIGQLSAGSAHPSTITVEVPAATSTWPVRPFGCQAGGW